MKTSAKNIAPSSIHVGCLVMEVALGREGKAFQRRQEYLINHSGAEYTCKRAKALWNVAILLKNGDVDMAIDVCQENSIAHSPHTGIPKGIEGTVVRRYVEAQRPSVIKRVAAALRWYTSITLSEPSKDQIKKALEAITGPSIADLSSDEIYQMGKRHALLALERYCDSQVTVDLMFPDIKARQRESARIKLLDYVQRKQEPIRYAETLKSTSKYYSRNKVPRDLKGVPYSSMCMSFMTEPWLPDVLDERTPCAEMRNHIRAQIGWSNDDQEFVGEISFLQEQGCKRRVVAKPSAWLQLAFVPLHDTLADLAEKLFPDSSCVRDQVRGAYLTRNHQLSGFSVRCTDLSSATDRFPVQYSLGVLDAFGLNQWADALRQVINRPFKCAYSHSGEVKYAIGQPMGLYGSFPLFHLSNMILAYGVMAEQEKSMRQIDKDLPKFSNGAQFLTVGDDIVFANSINSMRYRNTLQRMGVKLSQSKCYEGNVAEFAGFISVKTNKSVCTFRPYKVPDTGWIKNPIEFLDSLGAKLVRSKCTKGKWARIWQAYNYTRPWRDLANESVFPTDEDRTLRLAANRGDSRTLVNMAQAISTCTNAPLPDLSGSTRINQIPLFRERGMFDFYGYNPDGLMSAEREEKNYFRKATKRLNQDPLMQMVRSGELQEVIQSTYPDRNVPPESTENSDSMGETESNPISNQRASISTASQPDEVESQMSDSSNYRERLSQPLEARLPKSYNDQTELEPEP